MRAGRNSKPSGTETDSLKPGNAQRKYFWDFPAFFGDSQSIAITLRLLTGQTGPEF